MRFFLQCDFQVVYASGIHGKAGLEPTQLADDLEPLFEAVIRCIPEPRVDLEGPLQMLVRNPFSNTFSLFYAFSCDSTNEWACDFGMSPCI